MTERWSFVLYWLPPIVWAGLILVGTSLPKVPGPDLSSHNKHVHVTIYLILGLLMLRAFVARGACGSKRAAVWTIGAGGVFGALQEINQVFIPGRSGTFGDFVANLAGLILATIALKAWLSIRRGTDAKQSAAQGDDLDGGSTAR